MNAQQKETLLDSGAKSFLALVQQVDHMLDVIHFYMSRYPDESLSMAHKHEDLKEMINTLASKPNQLSEVIRRWKHDEPRVLSRLGVEVQLLNEIWITLEVLLEFFQRENIDCLPYNHFKARTAFAGIRQVNRCIP